MARFNLIEIDGIYLTSNGLISGKPCKIQVKGLNRFATTKTGQIQNSANGTPYAQLIDFSHKGLELELLADFMAKSVFDSIVESFEDSKNDATTFPLIINGDTGNYSLTAMPKIPDDIDWAGFSGGIIKGATFRVITT
jgi:hypothetical protein